MLAEQRRQAVMDSLRGADRPISATALAAQFSVSRQVIVGDVALLRASGEQIVATPRGYVIAHAPAGILRQVAVQHDFDRMAEELYAIVDQGCIVVDVIVEHPIYGELKAPLELSSRYDVGLFLERCTQSEAQPLSRLTEGIHLHTVACPNEGAFLRVREALQSKGFLLKA